NSTPAQVAPAPGASQHCDQNISSDPSTSCELAFNTFKAFVKQLVTHGSTTVEVYGRKSSTWYSIRCQVNSGAVTCTGGHEILVTFPLWAAEVYEPHRTPPASLPAPETPAPEPPAPEAEPVPELSPAPESS